MPRRRTRLWTIEQCAEWRETGRLPALPQSDALHSPEVAEFEPVEMYNTAEAANELTAKGILPDSAGLYLETQVRSAIPSRQGRRSASVKSSVYPTAAGPATNAKRPVPTGRSVAALGEYIFWNSPDKPLVLPEGSGPATRDRLAMWLAREIGVAGISARSPAFRATFAAAIEYGLLRATISELHYGEDDPRSDAQIERDRAKAVADVLQWTAGQRRGRKRKAPPQNGF